jgi:hypothetical protein
MTWKLSSNWSSHGPGICIAEEDDEPLTLSGNDEPAVTITPTNGLNGLDDVFGADKLLIEVSGRGGWSVHEAHQLGGDLPG